MSNPDVSITDEVAPPIAVDIAAHHSPVRRYIIPILKIGLAAGVAYYVIRYRIDENSKRVLGDIFLRSPFVLLTAVLVVCAQMFLGAQRLRVLLAPQQLQINYWLAVRLTWLGAFFDTFGVTSVGGDAIKAVYLAREVPRERRVDAVSVLLLDRLMGLWGLLSLTLITTLFHLDTLREEMAGEVKYIFIVPAVLLFGTLGLFSKRLHEWKPVQAVLNKLPMGATFNRAYGSLQRYGARKGVLFLAWLISLVVHTVGVCGGYVLMRGMGQQTELGAFFVAWLVSQFICSFAPAGGIGVGQVVFDRMFNRIAALPLGAGIVLATATQATTIFAKLPGLIAWLMSREHRHPPLDQSGRHPEFVPAETATVRKE
jgi:glycosyltransferase 2 family protein